MHPRGSVGGTDALDHSGLLLHEPAGSFAEVLTALAGIQERFRQDYRAVLGRVLGFGKPTAVCTASTQAHSSQFFLGVFQELLEDVVPDPDLRRIEKTASSRWMACCVIAQIVPSGQNAPRKPKR